MNLVRDTLTIVLIAAGAAFFIAGTVGLLRFPDFYTRVHSMAKADNVGLGLLVAGLALQSESVAALAQLLLVWILVLLSSVSGAHLLARGAYRRGRKPWRATCRR
ncbi:MAG: monovalent cation/H(+) antiporter subunit G [Gammaproteobacteria bacterium]|nr:monovalent cation/H(+) antiporter subunit G [Gammaproteobacteria bacterium]